MGIKPSQFAEMQARVAPKDKPKAPKDAFNGRETDLQRDMVRLLDQRGLFFVRSRMDKKTSVRLGFPDFIVFFEGGEYCAVEAKVKGGSLSDDQQMLFDEMKEKTGQAVEVVWCLEQFRDALDRIQRIINYKRRVPTA